MWRFILISFGLLGFAFYEASGGADYAPAPDSLQVAMRGKSLFATPLKVKPATQLAAADIEVPRAEPAPRDDMMDETVTRAQTSFDGFSGIENGTLGGFEIALASGARTLPGGDALGQRALDDIGIFSAETLVDDVNSLPFDQALVVAQPPSDIRSITRSSANMRSGPGTDYDKVEQLALGMQVEVLGHEGSWVAVRDLQTGQTGWMADWLITAAN
jgi:hypothetical protein